MHGAGMRARAIDAADRMQLSHAVMPGLRHAVMPGP